MDGVGRGFPPGDMRVSDADRDRAVSELGEALRVGRLTAGEFDERSGQALRARTGKELAALLADLPLVTPAATPASVPEHARHGFAVRAVMGVSAFCAILLLAKAVTAAMTPGIGRAGSVGPAAIAVLLIGLIIVLHAIRADRS
jgi:Domain of unknown function (DUF1707)